MTSSPPRLLGRYPTAVFRAPWRGKRGAELYIKHDGLTHPEYGGNKVRKLEHILTHAESVGARRLVTLGPAGSHHVFASALFGKKRGFDVAAVLFPQPETEHARQMLGAIEATGIELAPVRSAAWAAGELLKLLRPGDYLIPVGGSGLIGVRGYIDAAFELVQQVDAGELPVPDYVVVPVGSGGTAAGLAAGFAALGLPTRVLGAQIAGYAPLGRALVSTIAAAGLFTAARLRHHRASSLRTLGRLRQCVVADGAYRGRGYGYPTSTGQKAGMRAGVLGLELDPTYTQKAFALALALTQIPGAEADAGPVMGGASTVHRMRRAWEARTRHEKLATSARPLRVLYWHTLSAVKPLGGNVVAPRSPSLSDLLQPA